MKKALDRAILALVFIFLYAPIVVLIVFSFNEGRSRTKFTGFTLNWYAELFSDKLILDALYTTLAVALLSAILATLLGTLAAIGFHNFKKRPRGIAMTVNNIPMMNSEVITGISLMLLFSLVAAFIPSFQPGFITLLLAHTTFNIPYVVLSVLPKLRQMDSRLCDAALDLGATPFYAYRKVLLPEIMPGVVTGFIMAITLSIDDFVISYFNSGSKVQTLAVYIYGMTKKRVSPKINALSTIMFLTVLILLLVVYLRQNRDIKREKEKLKKESDD